VIGRRGLENRRIAPGQRLVVHDDRLDHAGLARARSRPARQSRAEHDPPSRSARSGASVPPVCRGGAVTNPGLPRRGGKPVLATRARSRPAVRTKPPPAPSAPAPPWRARSISGGGSKVARPTVSGCRS
jgi:hypothetical protein